VCEKQGAISEKKCADTKEDFRMGRENWRTGYVEGGLESPPGGTPTVDNDICLTWQGSRQSRLAPGQFKISSQGTLIFTKTYSTNSKNREQLILRDSILFQV